MRHLNKNRKFGRKRNQRKALLKNLMAALILREKITTTEEKAKEIRPLIEKSITLAKKQDLATYRELLKRFPKAAAVKLFKDTAIRYQSRPGGYIRIIKTDPRVKDAAKMAVIELVK
ncbi:50S ribosomal protein L17 [Candidatus Azambacteria bacterium RIFCSPHIGHO2_01_46_10]|uniref:50S ribosomal protein L17 n=4 Tax=Candidatus Azamiibacteriota TaxID=1752741 RepID=A0A1F5C8T2_9BACT|nr:MAG: 50S ribosomal protein L17 [Candidatus Azambacteria bacterium RIFCSPHIGHO2_02_46_12]OGD35695.1 MAG: 50S ribosomal protein L17 [Candidatus Azambacteria bacterium RIFCSPHIGHO2_01_46_10]OGD39256.1 MAG: 50S ribosomal protein L17 [Candidatus Azambacteria bacterium RIFCSPLOWO2_01_FULL_46_26]OGD43400.1 MAG: 50S ribosomal protein L17 [Candidatus Azambacteria bacterium RIFCSPLOWO2_02_FULL_46_11]